MPDFATLLQQGMKKQPAPTKEQAFQGLKDALSDKQKVSPSAETAQPVGSSEGAVQQAKAVEDAEPQLPQEQQTASSAATPFANQQPVSFSQETLEQIKASLNLLRNNLKNPEVVAESTRLILTEVNQHPDLRNFLLPEDCGLMTRALRESYGVAISKKQERKQRVTQTQKAVDDVLSDLADLDLGNIGQ